MNILICPDKFKECMIAGKVAAHIRNGIMKVFPKADCKIIPMADGGEGTVEALVAATDGKIERANVHDPLMRIIESFFGISGDGRIAVIEMAAASGLALLKPHERNPLIATSYGTGELVRHALDKGCREIILGIGGSASVDGGVGMAQALGIGFTDATGNEIPPGGGHLGNVYHIDFSGSDSRLASCKIYAACDVTNLLTGQEGAAYVYGPQKGAKPAMVKQLDDNLLHLSRVVFDLLHFDIGSIQGGGAAGGMGAGIAAFLNGELRPGFDLISQTVKLEKWIKWADLVITGEGRMDSQTTFGKTPAGVARMASKHNKPVIGFTGSLGNKPDKLLELGFTVVMPIADKPMTLEQSIADAGELLENAAERVARLLFQSLRPKNMNIKYSNIANDDNAAIT
jgi:glycerate kinase